MNSPGTPDRSAEDEEVNQIRTSFAGKDKAAIRAHMAAAKNRDVDRAGNAELASRREEIDFFRKEYFDGKTREEIAALLPTSKNPYFVQAGNEALAALDNSANKVVDGTHGNVQNTLDGKTAEKVEDPTATERVTISTSLVAEQALKVLKKAAKEHKKALKKGRVAPSLYLADQEIKDPEQAYKTFLAAIKMVKKQMPGFLRFTLDQLQFQKLAGEIVGKSDAKGETVDPVMLLHPVMRLATVIFHEILHKKNEVPNEGLVHTLTELYCGKIETTKEYSRKVENFMKFAAIYSNGKIATGAKDIYKLYYKASSKNRPEDYKAIRERFLKQAKKHKMFASDESAGEFFNEVFPELKVVKDKPVEVPAVASAETAADKPEEGEYALAA
jgi:hypothetical protein